MLEILFLWNYSTLKLIFPILCVSPLPFFFFFFLVCKELFHFLLISRKGTNAIANVRQGFTCQSYRRQMSVVVRKCAFYWDMK